MLKGERKGQYSIRINDQWRICFRWTDGDAFDVEIVDYHCGVTWPQKRVSADTALRLGKYFGVSPQTWMGLQGEYDLRLAQRLSGPELEKRVHRHAA